MSRGRAWLAVGLSVLQPGLGHAYLREWVRGATWFTLWVTTVIVVAPLPDEPRPADLVEYVTGAAAVDALSPMAAAALLAVVSVAAVDAYRRAAAADLAAQREGPSCPSCGREVDPDLDFCHWCTVDFEEARR